MMICNLVSEQGGERQMQFSLRQVQEKYREKKKNLYFAFIDLEKVYYRVPREVVSWATRQIGAEEWLVRRDVNVLRGKKSGKNNFWG